MRELRLSTEWLSLGRGTDQQVQLNDLRVGLAHARLRTALQSTYELETVGQEVVRVNGTPKRNGALWPGDVLELGRYRLTLQAAEDGADLVLYIAETASAREDRSRQRSAYTLSLEQTGLSRRRWAWWLALSVLLIGLAVPLAFRYVWPSSDPPDRLWQSGPLSDAHAAFGQTCSHCHAAPFERVQDSACTTCHEPLAAHSTHPAFDAAGEPRCASCHQEHRGAEGLVSRHPALCTDCHAQAGAGLATSGLPSIADFSTTHPAFSPRLPRVANGLQFPHQLHLAPLKTPQGEQTLVCADCHTPDAAGSSFAPITMTAHCASCHTLDFDPTQPQRVLPHGQPSEVAQMIRDYFAARVLLGELPERTAQAGLRRRPDAPPPARPRTEAEAARLATQTIDDVFKNRSCAVCHVVEAISDAATPWKIAPVRLEMHALEGARFDHRPHLTERCESCHAAATSEHSADVLLPGIETCRSCHGDTGARGEVPSTCLSCHGYHSAAP